jgi:hypothetical protein
VRDRGPCGSVNVFGLKTLRLMVDLVAIFPIQVPGSAHCLVIDSTELCAVLVSVSDEPRRSGEPRRFVRVANEAHLQCDEKLRALSKSARRRMSPLHS